MICPKCKGSLKAKRILYTGNLYYSDKTDVAGKTDDEIRIHTASGFVSKQKDKSINELLASTAGIGYLEKKLTCNKCGYSQEINNRA